jgi:carbonic anhydrase
MQRSAIAALLLASGLFGCTSSHEPSAPDTHAATTAADHPSGLAPADALALLTEGNQRFVSGHLQHPRQDPARRTELASGQAPSAIIVSCSDSRTTPEVLFDQGLGDLFVVRCAGNVIDDHALGSIEYAAEHLGTRLIVVLGHQRCGAVKAAKEVIASGSMPHDHIASLVESIKPAVLATKDQDVEATCKANVHDVEQALRDSQPVLHGMTSSGQLQVVGAYYELDTGTVSFLDK